MFIKYLKSKKEDIFNVLKAIGAWLLSALIFFIAIIFLSLFIQSYIGITLVVFMIVVMIMIVSISISWIYQKIVEYKKFKKEMEEKQNEK